MKKVMLFMLLLACWASNSNAQSGSNEKENVFGELHFEGISRFGIKQHGLTPITLGVDIQLCLTKRLSILATAERGYTLLEANGIRSNFTDFSAGGGVAYMFLNDNSLKNRLELRLQVVNTIGHTNRKHTSYDAGVYWYQESSRHSIAPLAGIGFRYEQSYTSGIRNWSAPYITLGVRF